MVLGAAATQRTFIRAAKREHYEVIAGYDSRRSGGMGEDVHLLLDPGDDAAVLHAAMWYRVSGILGLGREAALTAAFAAQQLGLSGIPYAETRLLSNKVMLRGFQKRYRFKIQEDTKNTTGGDAGTYVMTELVIRGGGLQPILWGECMTCKEYGDPMPVGCLYPARINENNRILLGSECKRLIELLQLQDAELSVIACILPGQSPYILRVEPVGKFSSMPGFISTLYRHNLLRDTVRLAAGDVIGTGKYALPDRHTFMALYAICVYRSGIVRQIRIHPVLHPYIRQVHWYVRQSQEIYATHLAGEILGKLLLQFPDLVTRDRIMDRILSLIDIVMDEFSGIC